VKTESSFEVSPAPHVGHSTAVLVLDETSFSKIRLQLLQRYSYSGMAFRGSGVQGFEKALK
jgi:hypothetical protein